MSHYRVRQTLRFCHIGSRFVFLDLAASRYFLLEGSAAESFADFVAGQASSEAIAWLAAKGLIELGEPIAAIPLPAAATSSLLDQALPAARLATVAEALVLQAIARRRVKREPVSALLAPSRGGPHDLERCKPLVAAFRRGSRYAQSEDQCLANGVAIRALLARRGLASELVIGVRLPFAAHCWVQVGDTILSDPLDRVQNFQTIVAVS
jgi:hypothetical protein